VNGHEAVNLLVARFPSLSAPLERFISEWGRYCEEDEDRWPGLYNLWGDVVSPTLVEPLMWAPDEDQSSLQALFDVIEAIAVNGDQYVKNFVAVGICEQLGGYPGWLARSHRYMGDHTRAISDGTEEQLGRAEPS